jgi:demethylmenaquinone methyltransferase/2-methoxy-6-polyprenyl-1,4-benzoquinol methylase
MPFMARFSCLWCGRAWETRGPDDLEGWAQLCPACVGAAAEDGFRRMRLRAGLAERAAAGRVSPIVHPGPASAAGRVPQAAPKAAASTDQPRSDADLSGTDLRDALRAYYRARATTYDDWYLRRGAYAHGAIDDLAWTMDLDAATLWLDGLPLSGEIVELAAGTGWWSPLLAGKGELWCYDAVPETLDLARQRLLAHGLRAHLHERDAWTEPDRLVDALFCGFWLSHVPRARLPDFLALCARWLKPGGSFAFVDSRADPASGSPSNIWDPATETALRRIDDETFRIPKVYYTADELERAITVAGFADGSVTVTSRFFLLGRARLPSILP